MTELLERNNTILKLDELVDALQKMDKESADYQVVYTDVFNAVYTDGIKLVEYKARQMQSAVRVDMGEMYSLITDALMYEVKVFDINKNTNFKRLFIEKLKQLIINYQKKMNNNSNIALTVSDDEEAKIEADDNKSNKSVYGCIEDKYYEDKEPSLYDLLEKFIEINPKGKVFYYFDLPVETRTPYILEILGVSEYNGTARKKVYDLKKKFEKFLILNNYKIQ